MPFTSSSTPLSHDDDGIRSPSHFFSHTEISRAGKEKERYHLEILLDEECLVLKGTGSDVEPARLSGHVSLYLSESVDVKEITLNLKGKARVPVPSQDS